MSSKFPNISHANNAFFDKKTGIAAVCTVIALHGLVGWGLVHMKMSTIAPPKVTPPLEISFIVPPTSPVPPLPEAISPKTEPKQTVQPTPTVKPKTEPKTTPKTVQKSLPILKPTVEKPPVNQPVKKALPLEHTTKMMATKSQPQQKPKQETRPQTKVDKTNELSQQPKIEQNILAAQQRAIANERAEQQRQRQFDNAQLAKAQQEQARQDELNKAEQQKAEQARQQALAQQKALAEQQERDRKQAQADAEKRQAAQDAKAKQEAEEQAREQAKKAQQDSQKLAQNNEPVNFSAGQASWRRQPNFSCSSNDTRGETLDATIRYVVDKQGNASAVTLAKATGNAKVDRQLLQQARSGKFHPFTKNGVPVIGIVNLPIRCQ